MVLNAFSSIQWFSIVCRKTKVTTLVNHKEHSQKIHGTNKNSKQMLHIAETQSVGFKHL